MTRQGGSARAMGCGVGLLLLTLLLGVVACTDPTRATDVQAQTEVRATATLTALARAIRAHDRAGFDQEWLPGDPALRRVADRLYDNLTRLPLTRFELAATSSPSPSPASPDDPQRAGRPRTVPVRVRWQLRGEDAPAEHRLAVTLTGTGKRAVVAGLGPSEEGGGAPLWALEAVEAARSSTATVIGPASGERDRWRRRAELAVGAVRRSLPAGTARRWSGRLVLELPSTSWAFARALGTGGDTYASIAAVAWPEGPDPARGPVHVVLNPGLTPRLDEATAQVLLAHEAVHVATRSAASPAPDWLVEGMADYVAYRDRPTAAARAEAELLRSVRATGPPRRLPPDAAFVPGAPSLRRSYGEAWSACRFVAARYSPDALGRLYRALDAGDDPDEAAHSVLRVSAADLAAAWAADLARTAKRG